MPESSSQTEVVDAQLFDALTAIVSRAAAAILAFNPRDVASRTKADASPVTEADVAAETLILDALGLACPGIPVISEEAANSGSTVEPGARFFLVDPLDGTREFIAGRPEYTVNLALVIDGTPAVGIIAAPALGLIWRGIVGSGAERLRIAPGRGVADATERTPLRTRPAPPEGLVATISRSHLDPATDAYLSDLPLSGRLVSGSAIKFCQVAEGSADLYPRLAPTMEWDVGAGCALIAAAGGVVTTPLGAPLAFGGSGRGFRVPAFLAWGDPKAAARFRH